MLVVPFLSPCLQICLMVVDTSKRTAEALVLGMFLIALPLSLTQGAVAAVGVYLYLVTPMLTLV